MNSRPARDERGMTLIESLVAISLFGLAAAAIGQLLTQQIRLEGINGTTTAAITLAEQELEDLRSLEYGDIASRSANTTSGAITYTMTTTIVPDSPEKNMKSITVAVTWTEPAGPQSYTAYAIYTDVTR